MNPYPSSGDVVMTNFDHEIDQDVADRLKIVEMSADYAAGNFNGQVWWDRADETYKCEVWRFHIPVEVTWGTLPEIMQNLSERYGWE